MIAQHCPPVMKTEKPIQTKKKARFKLKTRLPDATLFNGNSISMYRHSLQYALYFVGRSAAITWPLLFHINILRHLTRHMKQLANMPETDDTGKYYKPLSYCQFVKAVEEIIDSL